MSAQMGSDHLAREQERLERPRGWWIAGPGLGAVLLGIVSAAVAGGAIEHIWLLAVIALVQVGLLIWTAMALHTVRGRRPLVRTAGIIGIVVAALTILQGLGLVVGLALLSTAV